jgi:molybdopterin-guanine dinucleotide biosynthesis protein A
MSPAPAPATVTGLILAGGLGTRMGGGEKGLQPFRGRPLLAHAIDRLAPQVGRLLINANREFAAYAPFGHELVRDLTAGCPGPLAGLQAGLAACSTPFLALVPCDAPLFPPDLVARLGAALLAGPFPAAVDRPPDGLQPTFLLCRRDVAAALDERLAAGRRSIHGWLAEIGAAEVAFPDDRAFVNLNSLADIAALDH